MLERVRLDGSQSSRALLGARLGRGRTGPVRGGADALARTAGPQPARCGGAGGLPRGALCLRAARRECAGCRILRTGADLLRRGVRTHRRSPIGRIRAGPDCCRTCSVSQDGKAAQRGWFWQLQDLPDAPESRYLYPILAGNDFQEGLKNYRDLAYLGSTLDALGREHGRVLRHDRRARARLRRAHPARRRAARERCASQDSKRAAASIEGRFNEVVNSGDVAALGTAEQREQWRRIEVLEAALAADPDNPELAPLRDKLRLVRGVLFWDLNQVWRDRLYTQRRELRQLDQALQEAGTRWLRVQQARTTAPTTTGDFAARIARAAAAHERAAALNSPRRRPASSSCWPTSPSPNSRRRSSASPSTRCRRALRSRPSTTARRRHRGERRAFCREDAGARRRAGACCGCRVPGRGGGAGAAVAHAQGPAEAHDRDPPGNPRPRPARPGRWRTTGASSSCRRPIRQLRAEALRRLGDLSLESGELERMESEVTRVDLGGAEAIRLYTMLLKAHPDYPRNDQVMYQLARAYETTGQPEQALATLDEVVRRYPGIARNRRGAVPSRRAAVLRDALSRRRRRPTRR